MDFWLPPKPAIIQPAPERRELVLPYRKPVPVRRGMLIATPYIGLGAGIADTPLPALAFLQSATNTANQTTYTFSTQNFGAEDPTRIIVAAVHWIGFVTLSSATIGGVAATIHLQNVDTGGIPPDPNVAIISAPVPSGTSGNVVVTLSGGAQNAGIALYRTVNLASQTPFHTASDDIDVINMSLNVPNNGVVVAAATFLDAAAVATTGVTEDYEVGLESSTMVGGSLTGQTAQTGRAIDFDLGLTKYPDGAGVAASWS